MPRSTGRHGSAMRGCAARCNRWGGPRSACARYRSARTATGRPADWILRRYAWVAADRREVEEVVLPHYVNGLVEHWRESVEEDEERALFARMDAGESITPADIAGDRLLWGTPDMVIGQIERYRRETGCDHVHAAFGAGLPGKREPSVRASARSIRSPP